MEGQSTTVRLDKLTGENYKRPSLRGKNKFSPGSGYILIKT